MCTPPPPKRAAFSFQKPKATSYSAPTPGPVKPCFILGHFSFFFIFSFFFFHLKLFFFLPFPFSPPFDFLAFVFLFFLSVFFFFWCGGGCFWCFVFAVDFLVLFAPSLPHPVFEPPYPTMSLRMLQKVGAWSSNGREGRKRPELAGVQLGGVGQK